MRRSSLRRSSVVALASASVGVAAPIPDPSFNLFGGNSNNPFGTSTPAQLSTGSLNNLLGSLYNLVGSNSGSVQTGVNAQVEFQNILKSFGLNPVANTGGTKSVTSSASASPTASPRPSIAGSVSAQGGLNLVNPFAQAGQATNEIDNIVNGILGYGKGSVSAGVALSPSGVSIGANVGTQAPASPTASPKVVSLPSVVPVSPSVSVSVSAPKASGSQSANAGVQAQAQVNAQGIANGLANTINSLGNTVNGVVNGATNLVSSTVQNAQNGVKVGTQIGVNAGQNIANDVSSVISKNTPSSASTGVQATSSTKATLNLSNPLGITTGLQGFPLNINGILGGNTLNGAVLGHLNTGAGVHVN